MKVYDIDDGYNSYQIHSVVANSISEAERIYKGKYPTNIIKRITLHAEYVQIEKYDEQKENKP